MPLIIIIMFHIDSIIIIYKSNALFVPLIRIIIIILVTNPKDEELLVRGPGRNMILDPTRRPLKKDVLSN